jgi:hypothetical protein
MSAAMSRGPWAGLYFPRRWQRLNLLTCGLSSRPGIAPRTTHVAVPPRIGMTSVIGSISLLTYSEPATVTPIC